MTTPKAKTPWRLVKSLERLRAQLNDIYPNRSKASDGALGDTAHAARKSDHNQDSDGTVDAIDITHDPVNGVDIAKLANVLIAGKDRRISYIIANGEIISGNGGPSPWKRRKYTGKNKHTKHIHISVLDKYQDEMADWNLSGLMPREKQIVLKLGASGKYVEDLQANLAVLGYKPDLNGNFGDKTEAAVKAFQRASNLNPDGWAGSRTLTAIGEALKHHETQPKIQAAKQEANKAVDTAKSSSNVAALLGGLGGGGGLFAMLQGFDWQTVAVLLGGGAACLLLFLLLRRWIVPAIKDVKEQLS